MKTINKPGNNLGGLLKIWAVPADTFSIIGKDVSFISSDNIYEIYCSPESMQFSELLNRTNAGIRYNTTLSGFTPKDSEELQIALAYLEPRKWVVVFLDGNESYKLAGTAEQPLRLTPSVKSGKNVSDRSGTDISFTGETITRALFINNPF